MISLLRFIGLANAGIWLGATVFFTCFAGPAFFSDAMLAALKHRYYAGAAAQIILSRYFVLHYLCIFIALSHLLAEWFYLGRRFSRFTVTLWTVLTALILFGGLGVQPKLRELRDTMYAAPAQADRDAAQKSFRIWHGVSQTANLFVTFGVLTFFWRIGFPPSGPTRFGGPGKFRS